MADAEDSRDRWRAAVADVRKVMRSSGGLEVPWLAAVAMSAAGQYLLAELCSSASYAAQNAAETELHPKHLTAALAKDEELAALAQRIGFTVERPGAQAELAELVAASPYGVDRGLTIGADANNALDRFATAFVQRCTARTGTKTITADDVAYAVRLEVGDPLASHVLVGVAGAVDRERHGLME